MRTCGGSAEDGRHGAAVAEEALDGQAEAVLGAHAHQRFQGAPLRGRLLAQALDSVHVHLRLAHGIAPARHAAAAAATGSSGESRPDPCKAVRDGEASEHLLRRRRRTWMKSEAEIMPMTAPISSSHSGALATPCTAHRTGGARQPHSAAG